MTTAGDDDWLAAQLRETERGEAAGFLVAQQPRWLPIAIGAWAFGLYGGRIAFTDDLALGLLWALGLHGLLFGYMRWWHLRRRGVRTRGPAPREFRVFWLVVALMAVGILYLQLVVADVLVGWSAAAFFGVVMAVFAWLAERTHQRISRTVKERLA